MRPAALSSSWSGAGLASAKPVYTALLGVQPQADSPYYVGFDAAGQHIGLLPGGGPQGMTSPVAYWHVPDIEAKLAELTSAGATVKEPARHVGDLVLGVLVRQDFGAGLGDQRLVAAGMVAMLVGVRDLGDLPPFVLGGLQAFLMIQGIDGQRLAGLAAGDQVIKIATGIGGPDLFDDHCSPL